MTFAEDIAEYRRIARDSISHGESEQEENELFNGLAGISDADLATIDQDPAGPPAIPGDLADAVAWWNLRVVGTPQADASGNGNDLTVVNGPLTLGYGPGVVANTGLVLNSTTSQGLTRAISPGDDLDIETGDPFTLAIWGSILTGNSGNPRLLAGWKDVNGNVLALEASYPAALPGTLKARWRPAALIAYQVYCEVQCGIGGTGDMFMFVVEYDPALFRHRLEVWTAQDFTSSFPSPKVGAAELDNFEISGSALTSFNIGLTSVAGQFWNGGIATTAFFKRLLTGNEKRVLWNDALGRTYPGA